MIDLSISYLACSSFHEPASSAIKRVSRETMRLIQPSAALSLLNTAGNVLPPRSRITTTARRFEASVNSKLVHGTFAATFFLAVLAVLELEGMTLAEL